MNIMDLSIYNADISVTFILFMRPLTCKIIDFVELSSVELRSYKTVLLLSLFLVKFKLFVYFTFIESELDVNLSINSVLGEEEKKREKNEPISLLHSYTTGLRVCEVMISKSRWQHFEYFKLRSRPELYAPVWQPF